MAQSRPVAATLLWLCVLFFFLTQIMDMQSDTALLMVKTMVSF